MAVDFKASVFPTLKEIYNDLIIDERESNDNVVVLRAHLSEKDAEIFLTLYSMTTTTSWIVWRNLKSPERWLYHKKWVCHHHKRHKRRLERYFHCRGFFDIKIKNVTSCTKRRDEFLKLTPPLTAVIKISLNHSHPIVVADAMKTLRIVKERKMFYIVQFNCDEVKEKTVVPAAWLNTHNKFCIFPTDEGAAEVESLAKSRTLPKEGWKLFSVSTLQEFETFTQAKESLEKIKKAVKDATSEEISGRKRKRSCSELEDDENAEEEEDVSQSAADTANYSSAKENAHTEPLIVNVEPLAHATHFGGGETAEPCDQTNESTPSLPLDAAPIDKPKCACNSTCHATILQALTRIEKQLAMNTRLLQKFRTEVQTGTEIQAKTTSHFLPKSFPVNLPVKDVLDFALLEVHLQDEENFAETLPYFTALGGMDAKKTFKRIMETLISQEIAVHLNWKGRNGKKPFSSYSEIHKLIFTAIKQNPKSEVMTLSDVEKNIKDWLRFAPDRYATRVRIRQGQREKSI